MLRGVKKLFNSIFSILKLSLLLLTILLFPRLFIFQSLTKNYYAYNENNGFLLGLENISDDFFQKISQSRKSLCNIGLITNQTGKDQHGISNIYILLKKGLPIKKIFIPEHKNKKEIVSPVDKIPIITLTQENIQNEINDIDILIFDMQDCGMRQDLYLNTLFVTLEKASKYKKTMVILDRPNLLGHNMGGPLANENIESSLLAAPIPIRYGMTIGELALFYNKYHLNKTATIHVVPMRNYKRNRLSQNIFFSSLSENIKNLNACYCYSFLALFKNIKPFYLGTETDKAFECILLPDTVLFSQKKWNDLHKLLKTYGIENKFYRYFDKNKKNYFSGLQLKINDILNVESFNVFIAVANFFKNSGIQLEFSKEFDQSIGTSKVREFLEDKIDNKTLETSINTDLNSFFKKASSCFLYSPFPKVEYLGL